jgi:hypothetical protein
MLFDPVTIKRTFVGASGIPSIKKKQKNLVCFVDYSLIKEHSLKDNSFSSDLSF